jgi:hypothetical protein
MIDKASERLRFMGASPLNKEPDAWSCRMRRYLRKQGTNSIETNDQPTIARNRVALGYGKRISVSQDYMRIFDCQALKYRTWWQGLRELAS